MPKAEEGALQARTPLRHYAFLQGLGVVGVKLLEGRGRACARCVLPRLSRLLFGAVQGHACYAASGPSDCSGTPTSELIAAPQSLLETSASACGLRLVWDRAGHEKTHEHCACKADPTVSGCIAALVQCYVFGACGSTHLVSGSAELAVQQRSRPPRGRAATSAALHAAWVTGACCGAVGRRDRGAGGAARRRPGLRVAVQPRGAAPGPGPGLVAEAGRRVRARRPPGAGRPAGALCLPRSECSRLGFMLPSPFLRAWATADLD